jgi:uncharacterized protein (DUF1778 family)
MISQKGIDAITKRLKEKKSNERRGMTIHFPSQIFDAITEACAVTNRTFTSYVVNAVIKQAVDDEIINDG